ncbi:MAG TPA: phosphoglycerate dehydrogenase [Clostridium sp.]
MYKVIITPRSFAKYNNEPLELLEKNGCEIIRLSQENGDINVQVREHIEDVDGVIAGFDVYDKEILSLAKKLKVISRYGVGLNTIDLEAAKARGVAVAITTGSNEDSVADMAFALLISAARNIPLMDRYIKNGKENRPVGIELPGKTLGVFGLGRIGKGVVRRSKGFDMNILCCDVVEDKIFANEYGIEYCDFDTLLRKSDFITIHSPLIDDTRNKFGKEEFEKMKDSAILINTARGAIINEDDLYDALKANTIRGAAIDVTVKEPPIGIPLTELDNCIVCPHASSTTVDAVNKMSMLAATNLLDILQGKECLNKIK